ncbi:signal peptidase I [Sphingosinicella sp. CPCC 101087]|uniref:signal peptidase I n=1 Tax=Sphingosinicella sp. CPCC 101087 TaxID=2497754 RepID=UPI00101D3135|nr:signal peptidase I [Sphingosinicella sp. CPCC 101087]
MVNEIPPGTDASDSSGPPERRKESWWESIRFFLLLFLAAVAIRSLLFAPFSIPSGSMLPNLMIGDYLFVAKWPYGYSRHSFPFGIASFDGRILASLPERGDVVVFRFPGVENDDYIKRVIGLPGDTVEVRDGAVILNGEPVRRQRIADYAMPVSANSPCRVVGDSPEATERAGGPTGRECVFPRYRETLPDGRSYEVLDQGDMDLDDWGPIIVPEGQLFVMGDNRDDSADSRVPTEQNGVGLLPVDHLLGRATILFWSTDGSAQWLLPWTWFSAARWERIGETW